MNGGIVHGIGVKGKVMDYGGKDKESFQHKQFSSIHALFIYVKRKSVQKTQIVQSKVDPNTIKILKSLDKRINMW